MRLGRKEFVINTIMQDDKILDTDAAIRQEAHLLDVVVIHAPIGSRRLQETALDRFADEHMSVNLLMQPAQHREQIHIVEPASTQDAEIQSERLRIMMMKQGLDLRIDALGRQRIDEKIGGMAMADFDIPQIHSRPRKCGEKRFLVMPMEQERQDIAWKFVRGEAPHLDTVDFIIVALARHEHFNAQVWPQPLERLHEIKTIRPAPRLRRREKRRHVKIYGLIHDFILF